MDAFQKHPVPVEETQERLPHPIAVQAAFDHEVVCSRCRLHQRVKQLVRVRRRTDADRLRFWCCAIICGYSAPQQAEFAGMACYVPLRILRGIVYIFRCRRGRELPLGQLCTHKECVYTCPVCPHQLVPLLAPQLLQRL